MNKFIFLFPTLLILSCGTSKDGSATVNANSDDTLAVETIDSAVVYEITLDNTLIIGTADQHNVSISIMHYTPHCGGMAPTPEMEARQNQLQRNTTYVLVNLITDEKQKVKTDTSGTLYLNLPPGKYGLKEVYKDCDFDAFLQANEIAQDDFYQATGGEDCYKKWWATNLGQFQILAGDEVQHFDFQTQERCFTWQNPCVVYTGPWPP